MTTARIRFCNIFAKFFFDQIFSGLNFALISQHCYLIYQWNDKVGMWLSFLKWHFWHLLSCDFGKRWCIFKIHFLKLCKLTFKGLQICLKQENQIYLNLFSFTNHLSRIISKYYLPFTNSEYKTFIYKYKFRDFAHDLCVVSKNNFQFFSFWSIV